MTRIRTLSAGLLLAGALLVGAPVRAQDGDSKVDRLLQQVEALLTTLRSDPKNADTVAKLEEIAAGLRQIKDGGRGGAGGGTTPPGPPPGATPGVDEGIYRMTLETFLQGLDLKEDGKAAADQILREFVADYALAKKHEDEKSRGVVRDHSEKRISQSFAPRDANRLKDNLDTIIKRWEWMGGRRGR